MGRGPPANRDGRRIATRPKPRMHISTPARNYTNARDGHGDHPGGVPLWKEAGTRAVARSYEVEFLHYQARRNRFFAVRNAAQFALDVPGAAGMARRLRRQDPGRYAEPRPAELDVGEADVGRLPGPGKAGRREAAGRATQWSRCGRPHG